MADVIHMHVPAETLVGDIQIGIDPGMNGALAIIDERKVLAVHDMPTTQERVGKRLTKRILIPELLALLRTWSAEYGQPPTFLEKVHSMPNDGKASAERFGRSCGIVECAVVAARLPLTWVTPQSWKRRAGLLRAPKDQSRAKACDLYPDIAPALTRKRDQGRAEAILIARYGDAP